MPPNPVICALDTKDANEAARLAAELRPEVGAVKLGLEFFTANGPEGVHKVAQSGAPVFLDLKFHDIPNTVAGAIASARSLPVFMMTVHTIGGYGMMKAAAEATLQAEYGKSKRPLIVGVTVLTSLSNDDMPALGISGYVSDQVKRMAELAQKAELDGVVCSPHEIALLRKQCGPDFTLVVPGIRPAGSDAGDQKRTMSPAEALALGADYLVIGRPITQSPQPRLAAREIVSSLGRAQE